jgi:hypothetical protein
MRYIKFIMKNGLAASVVKTVAVTVLASQGAWADQLQCWPAETRDTHSPLMTAEVLPDHKIADVRFNRNDNGATPNVSGEIHGKQVKYQNSPYPDYMEYRDGIWLYLPADLSSQNLAATARLAHLNNKNSNAYLVVRNRMSGEYRGIHLICYSDIY